MRWSNQTNAETALGKLPLFCVCRTFFLLKLQAWFILPNVEFHLPVIQKTGAVEILEASRFVVWTWKEHQDKRNV